MRSTGAQNIKYISRIGWGWKYFILDEDKGIIYLGLDEDEGILSQVLAESQQEYLESLKRKAEEEKVNIESTILIGIMDIILPGWWGHYSIKHLTLWIFYEIVLAITEI